MGQSCPISLKNIDSNIVRLIALQSGLIATVYILSNAPIFATILLFDFTVRALRVAKFSPFTLLAKTIVKLLQLKPKPTDEAPKRFALFIGLLLLIVVHLFLVFDLDSYARYAVFILIVCAFLESFFDYCIGCKVYWLFKKFFRRV